MNRIALCSLIVGAAVASPALGQQAGEPSADEAAIRKTVAAYVQAFNKHDAKALADQWSPEAVYLNRITGEEVTGRAAIAEQFTALFKEQKDLKLDVSVESVRFLSPNVAVEQGEATLLLPGAEPDKVQYTAVYVKRDGRWLLDRVTDRSPEEAPSHYEQLKELDWMVGSWQDADDEVDIETECNWTKNRNFLTRAFAIRVGDHIDLSGMQIVGWDAAAKRIRSWTFDSDGGFAEATWTHKDDRWFVDNHGVLADGRKAAAVHIIRRVDDNSFTWQAVSRTAGGELLPNVDEVLNVRK